MATSKDVNLADTWLNDPTRSVGVKDQISHPFAVVTDHHKRKKTNTTRSSLTKPNFISASEGYSSTSYQADKLSEPAANLFGTPVSTLISAHPRIDRAGVCTDTFGKSNPTLDKKSHDTDKESLKMTIRQNPHDNGLRRSPRLQEQREKEDTKSAKPMLLFILWHQPRLGSVCSHYFSLHLILEFQNTE